VKTLEFVFIITVVLIKWNCKILIKWLWSWSSCMSSYEAAENFTNRPKYVIYL